MHGEEPEARPIPPCSAWCGVADERRVVAPRDRTVERLRVDLRAAGSEASEGDEDGIRSTVECGRQCSLSADDRLVARTIERTCDTAVLGF